eukprot:gnl/MRDRNA2_/MRDRNA2_138600_c0_seq1.p1 gnl/MRDRNA2_/MRDRNA2_138600_c0~~gnl/MRDRNA2_/MRDRNA2_138600_c0_seq1.p1  ORF type:complete len:364 (+),score=41.93 gnl/MRDRNA2_/MRDRNA2_138600_c0_seq1:50-1141(+)
MSLSISHVLVAIILQFNAEQLEVNETRNLQHSSNNLTLVVDKMNDKLTHKLFDRKLDALPLQRADLNDVTLMKPGTKFNGMPGSKATIRSLSKPPSTSRTGSLIKSVPTMFQQSWDVLLPKGLEEEMWDFIQGRKERRWAPDKRPESQRGLPAGPGVGSQLSWSGPKSATALEKITQWQHAEYLERIGDLMRDRPLGSAATALFGESVKNDAGLEALDADASAGLDKAIRDVNVALWGKIDGPVELAELIMGKFGKYHDVAVQRNTGQVAFNIYAPYLGQASFPYTEEQYLQKLESILALLNDLEQTWYIKEFLMSPLKPRTGLPSTPRSDTAVTVRLNLSPTWDDTYHPDIVDAWYMLRGRR